MIFRMLKQEIEKSLHGPFFLIGCIGAWILCLLGTCYIDIEGQAYSALQVLLLWSRGRIIAEGIAVTDMFTASTNVWFRMFVPIVLLMGYMITTDVERSTGNLMLQRVRTNIIVTSIAKVVSPAFVCGFMAAFGYVLYMMMVFIRFPVQEESEALRWVLQAYAVDSILEYVVVCTIGVFLYGVACGVFGVVVSIFFRDRYLLTCLPMLIMYLYSRMFEKYKYATLYVGKEEHPLLHAINIENLLYDVGKNTNWYSIAFVAILYALTVCLYVGVESVRRKRGVL